MKSAGILLVIASSTFPFGCVTGVVSDDHGSCFDPDGDGYGPGCVAGRDCDSSDGALAASCPITLAWDAPTANTDASPLTDLAGYRLYWGQSPGAHDHSADLGLTPNCVADGQVTTCTVSQNGFSAGTYYFAVTARNSAGYESILSDEVSHTFE